tara:strand:- start:47 stop:604 length:558 start_codon:yes stop_codon:yes gene_type:complete
MAIDQRGQVTTTGILNKPNMNVQAPNMNSLVPPPQKEVRQPPQKEVRHPSQVSQQPVSNTPRESGIIENIQNNITAEDMTVLAPILSPSVKSVLAKIVPEITPLLEGIGTNEETVPVKVSTFTSLPGDIQDFIIQSSTEDQMDTNNVPLDTPSGTAGMMSQKESEMPETAEGDIDFSQIDEGLIS